MPIQSMEYTTILSASLLVVLMLVIRTYMTYSSNIHALMRLNSKTSVQAEKYVRAYDLFYDKGHLPLNTLDDFENGVPMHGFRVDDQWAVSEILYESVQDLCRIGGLKKMYVPPDLDGTAAIHSNQILLEQEVLKHLKVPNRSKLLEFGCGCGAIARHMSEQSDSFVTGINIDKSTLYNFEHFL